MDDMHGFERQVADEMRRSAGSVQPVDDGAVYATVTDQSSRWGFHHFFTATKFAVAAGLVVLFGGFLLMGGLTQPSETGPPAAGGSASPEVVASVVPTQAPGQEDASGPDPVISPKEDEVKKLRTPMATALAIGLLAAPSIGVEAQADLMAPGPVTGTTTFPQEETAGSRAWIDGAIRADDVVTTHEWVASDPRLSGTHTTTYSYDLYEKLEMFIAAGTVVHENEGGRWVGTASYLGGAELGETTTIVMHGEGAYEGLTAYVVIDEEGQPPSFSGAIFPGDMPGVPPAE